MFTENSIAETVVDVVSQYIPYGERKTSSGVWLVCPTPTVAPEAWLHVIYTPLLPEDVSNLETQLGVKFPDDFQKFLLRMNGVKLFSYWTTVFGKRESYKRTGDDSWQPHDIIDHNNQFEVPKGTPLNITYFGTTNNANDWCFFDFNGNECLVGITNRQYFEPKSYYKSFGNWLENELAEGIERTIVEFPRTRQT